jgi:hypothetical protein
MWGGNRNAKQDAAQTARWAETCRALQREALELASGITEPEAKASMLYQAESFGRLAERAELRRERLAFVGANLGEFPAPAAQEPTAGPARASSPKL